MELPASTVGDIEGALDTVAPLFKRLVVSGHELPSTLTSSSGALYGGFLHNVVQRVAQYICDTHRGGLCRPS